MNSKADSTAWHRPQVTAFLRWVPVIVSIVVLSSCGLAGGDEKEPKAQPGKPSGAAGSGPVGSGSVGSGTEVVRSHAMATVPGEVRVDLMKPYRANGKTMVRFRFVNEGSKNFDLEWSTLQRSEPFSDVALGHSISGVHLLDPVNGQLYYPLFDAGGQLCLCSHSENVETASIEPGKSLDLFAAFPAAPESVQTMTVIVPNTPPFRDVPVAPAGKIVPQENTTEADIAGAEAGELRTEDVLVTVEDENKAVDDDGKSVDVRLSADVLFALNKATVRPKANEVLRGVASQIDDSPSETIKIDGHTDSSGNDGINVPLSKRRAEAVRKVLEGMVTRPGVKYATAGHGSEEPVADNSTAEGRKRNRRVTVSFERPQAPEPTAAPRQPSEASTADPSAGSAVATVNRQNVVPTTGIAWPKELEAEILQPVRGANGYTTVVWKMTNNSQTHFALWGAFTDGHFDVHGEGGPHDVTLRSGEKRYLPLRDVTKRCICSRHANVTSTGNLAPGETRAMWAIYQLPDDVTSVTVEIPWFHHAHDVPIE